MFTTENMYGIDHIAWVASKIYLAIKLARFFMVKLFP